MGVEYNWGALAYAILSPAYCCVEKAFAYIDGPKKGRTTINVTDWVTYKMLAEMACLKKLIGNKKTAELYGIDPTQCSRMIKRYNEGVKWWY